jgi:hypothetical protein
MKKQTRNTLLEIATRLVRTKADLEVALHHKDDSIRQAMRDRVRNSLTMEATNLQNVADSEAATP